MLDTNISKISFSNAQRLNNSPGRKAFRISLNGSDEKAKIVVIKYFIFFAIIFDKFLSRVFKTQRKWAKLDINENKKIKTILINISSLAKRTSLTRQEILSKTGSELSKTLASLKKEVSKPIHIESINTEIDVPKKTLDGMPIMAPLLAGTLYQMTSHIHEIFNKHGIQYWAACGTLLGIERHQGLIPHDDDIDLCLFPEEEKKLANPLLIDDLKKVGLHIANHWLGKKICPIAPHPLGQLHHRDGYKYNTPSVDLFFTEKAKINDEVVYRFANELPKQLWGSQYYSESELFDKSGKLETKKFGPIQINAPTNGKNFCMRTYGENWFNETYLQWNHLTEERLEKRAVKITDYRPPAFEEWDGLAKIPEASMKRM